MRNYEAFGLMRQMPSGEVIAADPDYPEMSSKTIISNLDQNLFCKDDDFIHDEKENLPPSVLVSEFLHEAFYDQLHLLFNDIKQIIIKKNILKNDRWIDEFLISVDVEHLRRKWRARSLLGVPVLHSLLVPPRLI